MAEPNKIEEVKKILEDRIPLHGERELDRNFLTYLARDICQLFVSDKGMDIPIEARELIEDILKEIWHSGKDYSQTFDFFECVNREGWINRILKVTIPLIGKRKAQEIFSDIENGFFGIPRALTDRSQKDWGTLREKYLGSS